LADHLVRKGVVEAQPAPAIPTSSRLDGTDHESHEGWVVGFFMDAKGNTIGAVGKPS